MNAEKNISANVLRYTLLPQIVPRIKNLFGHGFAHLSYFIAIVFNTVGILPNDHIYLKASSHGRYSVWQAMAAAANHIPLNRKNLDKMTIFGVVLAGLAMMVLQIVLLAITLLTGKAFAYNGPGLGPTSLSAFFETSDRSEDIAFRLLDLVFGVPGIFDSKDAGSTAFHTALHALLEFYSFGMLLIATIIFVYLTITVVMETAQTGIPFGRRFNRAWVPVRIILFFGLLLPTGNGLNLAQYVLLNAAKHGSNLATNAWNTFDRTSSSAYLGAPENLIARPNAPEMSEFVTFMVLAKTCAWAEGRVNGYDIQPYIIYNKANSVPLASNPAFVDLAKNVEGGTIEIRFGVKDETLYANEHGQIYPFCGALTMPIVDRAQPGSAFMQKTYMDMTRCLWDGSATDNFACNLGNRLNIIGQKTMDRYGRIAPYNPFPDKALFISSHLRGFILTSLNKDFEAALTLAIQAQTDAPNANDPNSFTNPDVDKLGWGGAGIWYNKIAEQNGSFTGAVYNIPSPSLMPDVMEFIRKKKGLAQPNTPSSDMYTPLLVSGDRIPFQEPQQHDVAVVLNQQYQYWTDDNSMASYKGNPATQVKGATGNAIVDTINLVMGTQGLFDMCKNTNVHPLAQLAGLGKGLVDHSIRSFGLAAGFSLLSIVGGLFDPSIGKGLKAIVSFFQTIATMGLALGFILYYVLPFVPFVYFFFAVMTWVKSIFEAMVGMPLWALAHLKIDGGSIPGSAAEAGYFYILEIFIRPIFIILSFVGSVIIFGAMVKVLNQVFYLVISNLSGHTVSQTTTGCFGIDSGMAPAGTTEAAMKRGPIDEFFYTIVYAIIVYMMAMSSFKLVDMIPDRVLGTWMSVPVRPFGQNDGDPAEGIVSQTTKGIGILSGRLNSLLFYR